MHIIRVLIAALSIKCVSSVVGPRYCGSELVFMLELICGGLFFERNERSVKELDSSSKEAERNLHTLSYKRSIIRFTKRGGVADECCLKSCSFEQLQNYCLYDQSGGMPEEVMQVDSGVPDVNNNPTTTTPTLNIPPTTVPSFQSGVRQRQRNRWFFVHPLGHNPTRRPFYNSDHGPHM